MQKKTKREVRSSLSSKLSVMELVTRYEGITRREMAARLSCTPMTISNTVKALMDEGMLEEKVSQKKDSGLGRKPDFIDITDRVPYIVGVSMTRKSLKVALMDFRNRMINKSETPFTSVSDEKELLQIIEKAIDGILENNGHSVIAIGFSCFGPVDTRRGKILDAKFFHGIGEIDIKKPLEEHYGLPVLMIHDANASALAERYSGSAYATDNFMFVRMTAGIGCGLVLNGMIYEGAHGLCGELGHTSLNIDGPECECGQRGCMENYINTDLITKRINDFHHFQPALTWNDIVSLYNSPQQMFGEHMDDICRKLSHAITNVVNLLDIECVYLEYPGQEAGDKIERNIEKIVNESILAGKFRSISVKQSTYMEESTLIGTADLVKAEVFSGALPFIS